MITNPVQYVGAFCDAGADWVSIHAEAKDDLAKAVSIIREKGKSPGIVINPDTPIEKARPYLATTDFILVMSVFPGFGGQSFIASVLDKVRALRAEGYAKTIEIDGGINVATARLAAAAGADVLVAGTAVFGQKDRASAMRALLDRA
jgi:Pentose-5-phosphate-3-epimerase